MSEEKKPIRYVPHDEHIRMKEAEQLGKEWADKAVGKLKAKLRAMAGKGPSRKKAQRAPHTSVKKVESDRARKNSRVKGSRGENDVAKVFSKWCGEVVRRTPQSGGWSNARFGVTGDLVCDKKSFPFHVEVKHREGWVLDDLVTGMRRDHDKSIVQWWIQCLDSCPKQKWNDGSYSFRKEPLLVFRRNRQPWLVMMNPHVPSRRGPMMATFTLSIEHYDDHDVVVMLLEDFLAQQPVPEGLRNHRSVK